MIEELLPATVTAVEARADPPAATLFPEEEALLVKAVDKRRREFRTARHCARTALARLGIPPAPILPGPGGAPRWPAGIVGSMTHCHGYRAAAVAHDRDVATIGIDAESHVPLPDGVLRMIAVRPELDHLAALAEREPRVEWPAVLFSAKESVYKAWYPVAGRWLGFEDAEVTIDPDGSTFAARLLVPPIAVSGQPLGVFHGRWRVRDGLVLTAVTCENAATAG